MPSYPQRGATPEEVEEAIRVLLSDSPIEEAPPSLRPLISAARKKILLLEEENALLIQTSGELCDNCGWRMLFPGEPCRNCGKESS
jgi:hypothetical protein